MKIKLNKSEIADKILGCWIGKNIGGTMGVPYESLPQINDIHGFNSPAGEPLPNDDLDLQLVWLRAMEHVGPRAMSANVLADYWLSYVTPHFNEYGIGKSNLEMGLLPPLSGELNNIWKHSNGAWIRSEIWACLAPGLPNVAMKYAIMDASIDHGLAEGTYAEMFTASLESMAFFENDVRTLVEKALANIPEGCRVAKAIRIVLDGYDNKKSWVDVRNEVVKDSEDLGWFQAPANVAFTVIGLIYGEGDFKKSMIIAINCGDDTDCTGGTSGALLGIIYGASGIPADWREYIGDRIMTICINASYLPEIPATCTELTERVIKVIPIVMDAYGIETEFTDGKSEIVDFDGCDILKGSSDWVFTRSPYSFEIPSLLHTNVVVEYDREPIVEPNSQIKVKLTFDNRRMNSYYYQIDVHLPEGWTADYKRTCYCQYKTPANHGFISNHKGMASWEMTINVGENVDITNRIPIMVSPKGHAMPIMIPLVLLG